MSKLEERVNVVFKFNMLYCYFSWTFQRQYYVFKFVFYIITLCWRLFSIQCIFVFS